MATGIKPYTIGDKFSAGRPNHGLIYMFIWPNTPALEHAVLSFLHQRGTLEPYIFITTLLLQTPQWDRHSVTL